MAFEILGQLIPASGGAAEQLYIGDTNGGAVVTYISVNNSSDSEDDFFGWSIVPQSESAEAKHIQDGAIKIPHGEGTGLTTSLKMSVSIPIGFGDRILVGSKNGHLSITFGGMKYAQ